MDQRRWSGYGPPDVLFGRNGIHISLSMPLPRAATWRLRNASACSQPLRYLSLILYGSGSPGLEQVIKLFSYTSLFFFLFFIFV